MNTFRCIKSGSGSEAVYVPVTWLLVSVSCPAGNYLCNSASQAYVPAITVCNQKLFNNSDS